MLHPCICFISCLYRRFANSFHFLYLLQVCKLSPNKNFVALIFYFHSVSNSTVKLDPSLIVVRVMSEKVYSIEIRSKLSQFSSQRQRKRQQ